MANIWLGAKLLLTLGVIGGVALASQLPVQDSAATSVAAAADVIPPAAVETPDVVRAGAATMASRLTLDRPLEHGDYAWQPDGVPDGPITITIDLSAQTLSVFRGNYEIGRAAILYGATDKPTPIGTFPIKEKDVDHVSNLYDAPMPYMLRLTNDGVAIHGSNVVYGSATHGCIGVPDEFAALLFEQAKIGDRVTILDAQAERPAIPTA